jgi:sulfate transport system ATP-binding protein
VDLRLGDGEPVFAQLTRTEAAQLELKPGDIVWLAFAGDRDARLVREDDRLDAVA